MKLFDSHAHYDDPRFDEDRDEVIKAVRENGVRYITNIGASLATSRAAVALSKQYDFIYAAVGVHPSDAESDSRDPNWLDELESMYRENDKVRAIGEIGLDYYYGKDDREIQAEVFRKQMALAAKIGANAVIHDRDAHEDTLKILSEFPTVTCVIHSFSGSFEMAKEVLKKGHYISFNGVLTFKNAKKTVEVLSRLDEISPDARQKILLETDCPYLTPVPHRGERNRSDLMEFTAMKAGELLGITPEAFAELTFDNACRFYGIAE